MSWIGALRELRLGRKTEMTSLLRLRRAYVLLVALGLALLLPQFFFRAGPWETRAGGALLTLGLFAHVVHCYRRGGPPWYANGLEAVFALGIGLSLGSMDRVLSYIFPALLLRATYGGVIQTAAVTATYIGALVVGSIAILPDGAGLGRGLSLAPFLAITGFIGSVMRGALEERAALVEELRESENRFRRLVQNSSDVIMVVDRQGAIRYHTPSVQRMLGYDSLLGRRLEDVVHADDRAAAAAFLARAAGQATMSSEWRVRHQDGSWIHVEAVSNGELEDDEVGGIALTVRDVSERKALEQRLTHLALHDALTGLPNRDLLREEIHEAIDDARSAKRTLAVLFIDLDDFKRINDTFGHLAGDELLVAAAARLAACLRPGDIAARLGGDEFAVMLPTLSTEADAEAVAKRIIEKIGQPFEVGERRMAVQASIGIAFSPLGETSTEELLRDADIAMYAAKSHGKARYEIFGTGEKKGGGGTAGGTPDATRTHASAFGGLRSIH